MILLVVVDFVPVRFVSVVGCALDDLCPAVGHALFTSCRSALLTRCGSALLASFHQDHPSVRIYPVCWRTRSPASLFASASVSPHERRTHRFCGFTLGMVVNSAVPCVLPLSCVAGNTSSLSLCFKGVHIAPFVGLWSARFPAIVHCGTR